jgi:lysophospholipase L1-like esterase
VARNSRAAALAAAIALVPLPTVGEIASPDELAPPRSACEAPAPLLDFHARLARVDARVAAKEPIVIVAIGSSSTAGSGASAPEASYPARFEAALRAHLPRTPIQVINVGVPGEEASDMLARFPRDVFGHGPDLVVWQLGTNSVIRNRSMTGYAQIVRSGLRQLKGRGIDAIVMNPQYAPKVLDSPEHAEMLRLIDAVAGSEGVPVFDRYAIMRHWLSAGPLAFQDILSPDGLHLNDWSYDCIGRLLADAVFAELTPPRSD